MTDEIQKTNLAVEKTVHLLAAEQVARFWETESVLPGMSVGGLAGHRSGDLAAHTGQPGAARCHHPRSRRPPTRPRGPQGPGTCTAPAALSEGLAQVAAATEDDAASRAAGRTDGIHSHGGAATGGRRLRGAPSAPAPGVRRASPPGCRGSGTTFAVNG